MKATEGFRGTTALAGSGKRRKGKEGDTADEVLRSIVKLKARDGDRKSSRGHGEREGGERKKEGERESTLLAALCVRRVKKKARRDLAEMREKERGKNEGLETKEGEKKKLRHSRSSSTFHARPESALSHTRPVVWRCLQSGRVGGGEGRREKNR